MPLTVEQIASKKNRTNADKWLADDIRERGAGRLVVRIPPDKTRGVRRFYFRYSENGQRKLIPLGTFIEKDRTAENESQSALTLKEARKKAEEYRDIYKNQSRDVAAFLEEQKAQEDAQKETRRRREEAERHTAEARRHYTLRRLLEAYAQNLEVLGKHKTSLDAANLFKNHVYPASIAGMAASEITARDVTSLLRTIIAAGKGRTAAKVRAYMRAAYSLAVAAELDPDAPGGFEQFGLTANPVSAVKALSKHSNARERVLTVEEMRAFLVRLAAMPDSPQRAAIRLILLTGGQRAAQLLRLRRQDSDLDARRIVLFDPKGNRKDNGPRRHELPLTEAAVKVLAPLEERARKIDCEWIFSTDGKAHITPETLSKIVNKLSKSMRRNKEVSASFQLSDLRRTCETMMAGMKIGRDVRAHILSHGLGGVQARHYDKHGYGPEKSAALAKWCGYLARVQSGEALRADVVILPKGKTGKLA